MSRVGLLGLRGTGKSTIRQLLRARSLTSLVSTPGLEYYISKLTGSPAKFIVLVDTPGMVDTAGEQWKAAKDSTILVFAFDRSAW